MKTPTLARVVSTPATSSPNCFIGIDFHKRYSVYAVVDPAGARVAHGRIEGNPSQAFRDLVVRHGPRPRVTIEACMNVHRVYEALEDLVAPGDLILANPLKCRLIAEAQIKTDKLDAFTLAQLLRGGYIAPVHIPSRETRQRREILRQRCFFVRERTRVRNRILRLLGSFEALPLPQAKGLFGVKAMAALKKLELPGTSNLLLQQQLDVLETLQKRIREDEKAFAELTKSDEDMRLVESIPGFGPILAGVLVHEIDGIERFVSATKLVGYAGLCPSTSSSGGKTVHGRMLLGCNKWLRWALIEAAWVAVGCDGYFGQLYKQHREPKNANKAIVIVARRMCRIVWQLLTQRREFAKNPPVQNAPRGNRGRRRET